MQVISWTQPYMYSKLFLLAGMLMTGFPAAALARQNKDTVIDVPYKPRYYRLRGIGDPEEFFKKLRRFDDSIFMHEDWPMPPQRQDYFWEYDFDLIKKPKSKQYKKELYQKNLQRFIQDSTRYYNHKRKIDSLQHLIDSLDNLLYTPSSLAHSKKSHPLPTSPYTEDYWAVTHKKKLSTFLHQFI